MKLDDRAIKELLGLYHSSDSRTFVEALGDLKDDDFERILEPAFIEHENFDEMAQILLIRFMVMEHGKEEVIEELERNKADSQ